MYFSSKVFNFQWGRINFNLGPDRLEDETTWAEKTNDHLSPSLTKHKKKTMTYDAGRALKDGSVKLVYGIT